MKTYKIKEDLKKEALGIKLNAEIKINNEIAKYAPDMIKKKVLEMIPEPLVQNIIDTHTAKCESELDSVSEVEYAKIQKIEYVKNVSLPNLRSNLDLLTNMRIPSPMLIKRIKDILVTILSHNGVDNDSVKLMSNLDTLSAQVKVYEHNMSLLTETDDIGEIVTSMGYRSDVTVDDISNIECGSGAYERFDPDADVCPDPSDDKRPDDTIEVENVRHYNNKAKIILPKGYTIRKSIKIGDSIQINQAISEATPVNSIVGGVVYEKNENNIVLTDYTSTDDFVNNEEIEEMTKNMGNFSKSYTFIRNVSYFMSFFRLYDELGLSSIPNILKKHVDALYNDIIKDCESENKSFEKKLGDFFKKLDVKQTVEQEKSMDLMKNVYEMMKKHISKHQSITSKKISNVYYVHYEKNHIFKHLIGRIRMNDMFFSHDDYDSERTILDSLIDERIKFSGTGDIIKEIVEAHTKKIGVSFKTLLGRYKDGTLDNSITDSDILLKKIHYLMSLYVRCGKQTTNISTERELLKKESEVVKTIIDKHITQFNKGIELEVTKEEYSRWSMYSTDEYDVYEFSDINVDSTEIGVNEEYKKIKQKDQHTIKYWRKYLNMATLTGIPFLSTGLLVMGAPIMLPVIYTPIKVIKTSYGCIVIGIAMCGIAFSPLILYVNMSNEFRPIIKTPDFMILEKLKREMSIKFDTQLEFNKEFSITAVKNITKQIKAVADQIRAVNTPPKTEVSFDYKFNTEFIRTIPIKREMYNNFSIKNAPKIVANIKELLAYRVDPSDIIGLDFKAQLSSDSDKYIEQLTVVDELHRQIDELNKLKSNVKTPKIPIDIKIDLNKRIDQIQELLSLVPIINIAPNSISFGTSIKKPLLSSMISNGMDEVYDSEKISKFLKSKFNYKTKILSQEFSTDFAVDGVIEILRKFKLVDIIPEYDDLSFTNIQFMAFLTTKYHKMGISSFGLHYVYPLFLGE